MQIIFSRSKGKLTFFRNCIVTMEYSIKAKLKTGMKIRSVLGL
jgi:hypothetical protein